VNESPPGPRSEGCELRLTPLVVQSFDSCLTAAPPSSSDAGSDQSPERSDSAPATKDDIPGWPDELLINSANVPDCTLDSAATKSQLRLAALWMSNRFARHDDRMSTSMDRQVDAAANRCIVAKAWWCEPCHHCFMNP
jgi:hypothetical protein